MSRLGMGPWGGGSIVLVPLPQVPYSASIYSSFRALVQFCRCSLWGGGGVLGPLWLWRGWGKMALIA